MATMKPRITITFEPEAYAVLRRVATLQRGPVSRVVSDLITETIPALSSFADVMEATQQAIEHATQAEQEMRQAIREATQQAEQDMRPLLGEVIGQYDRFATEMQRIVSSASSEGEKAPNAAESPRPVITGATKPKVVSNPAKRESEQGGG